LLLNGRECTDTGITALFQSFEDDIRLFSEINLEPDMVYDVVFVAFACLATTNGNHSDEIAKGTAITLVIDDADLTLFICSKHLPHALYKLGISVYTLISTANADRGWCLEEATIATEDLILRVSSKAAERRRAVYDGMVVPTDVDDYERAGEINWTERNTWRRTGSDTGENGKKIEARGRVNWKTKS
jgi:hypothetical protein